MAMPLGYFLAMYGKSKENGGKCIPNEGKIAF